MTWGDILGYLGLPFGSPWGGLSYQKTQKTRFSFEYPASRRFRGLEQAQNSEQKQTTRQQQTTKQAQTTKQKQFTRQKQTTRQAQTTKDARVVMKLAEFYALVTFIKVWGSESTGYLPK